MSKSILIMDTPEYCAECPLSANHAEVCHVMNKCITGVKEKYGKPEWCPCNLCQKRKK